MAHRASPNTDSECNEDEEQARRRKRIGRVAQRPFQAPPLVLDLTKDAPYDLRWKPLRGDNIVDQRLGATFDRRALDRGILKDFEDHGDKLRDANTSLEDFMSQNRRKMFEEMETQQTYDAQDVILKLRQCRQEEGVYDNFKLQPASNKLSSIYLAQLENEQNNSQVLGKTNQKAMNGSMRTDEGLEADTEKRVNFFKRSESIHKN